jgi:hypothetical protein
VTEHATNRPPVVTATDSHPYIGADAVVALLQPVAEACRNLADDPDRGIDFEVDNRDRRASNATR